MFGFLKDKIKKSIERLTGAAKTEEPPKVEGIKPKVETKPPTAKEKPKVEQPPVPKPEEQPAPRTAEPQPVEVKVEPAPVAERTAEPESKKTKHKEKREEPKGLLGGLMSRQISEEELDKTLWDLQVGLLEADVAVETAEKICEGVKRRLTGEKVKRFGKSDLIEESFRESIEEVLEQEDTDLVAEIKKAEKPYLIVFLGFNGAGKTTTIARFAHALKKKGISSVMAAADTWRAAAIQQLEKHGENLGIRVIKHDYGADAAAVIFDAVKYAKANHVDAVLADTAGRAHTNKNLMEELHKIIKVNKPQKKILIVDSLTGNDALEQARVFDAAVDVDGVILTKMDVNEKGGAALSVASTIQKPILYIGVGQNYDDLKPYKSKEMVAALLG